MRLHWIKLNKLGISLIIMAFLSFVVGTVPSQAAWWNNDKSGTQNNSEGMSAGWGTSAATEAQVKQIEAKEAKKSSEDPEDKVKPDLKKKKSTAEATTTTKQTVTSVDSLDYDVEVGSGDAGTQVYDENGRLLYEEFNGVRHIYAGFDDFGTAGVYDKYGSEEKNAIEIAIDADYTRAGDILIVSGGEYENFLVNKAITLYGGYSFDGGLAVRDIASTPTKIIGGWSRMGNDSWDGHILIDSDGSGAEINGFTIEYWSGEECGIITNSSDITITNCNITGMYLIGIWVRGSAVITNNTLVSGPAWGTSAIHVGGYPNRGIAEIRNNVITGWGQSINAMSSDLSLADNEISGYAQTDLNLWQSTAAGVASTDTTSWISDTLQSTETTEGDISRLSSAYWRNISAQNLYGQYSINPAFTVTIGKNLENSLSGDKLVLMLKGLLSNKDALLGKDEAEIDAALIAELMQELLDRAALSVTVTGAEGAKVQEMEIAMMLADILKNPTEEQQAILDAIEALINDAKQLEETSDEIEAASDGLIQMATAILLGQAIPDLFKEGDMAAIRGIFSELDEEKSVVLLEYQHAVKAYYKSIIEELASNMVMLQIKGLLAKNMTEEKLRNLPTRYIDEILDKIRNVKDKTVTEEGILKKEADYREKYLTPAVKKLEESMKSLLGEFTQRLFTVLDGAGVVKEVKEGEGKPVISLDLSLN